MPNRFLRWTLIAVFSLSLIYYGVSSWRWPLIWDMQVLHYVSFLMDHGWAPYRQIGDMNMPGAYLFEHWALHVFGSSDPGWRLWDFTLCAVLAGGMLAISRPYDWLAGVVAAGVFILTHAAEGPQNAGQREQVMAVLMIAGTALLFEAVRQRRAWLMFPFGLFTAMAGSVKPTVALFGPVVLFVALLQLRRAGVRRGAYAGFAIAGFVTACVVVLHFLIGHDSLRAFGTLLTQVIPHYAGTNQLGWGRLLSIMLQLSVFVYAACAVLAYALNPERVWNWEQAVLLLGVLFGVASYLGQRKGFIQHRYPLTAFVLLWASLQIVLALRASTSASRWTAALALLLLVGFYVPRNLYWIHSQVGHDDFSSSLETDLRQLGPDNLQHKIQCLDIVDGCLNALFHLQIVQSTGSTGDLLLFLPVAAPEVERARSAFWNEILRIVPEVYVLVNWQFGTERRTFAKLDAWPAFANYLQSQYVLVRQMNFPRGEKPFSAGAGDSNVPAYRLYVRRDSALLSKALPLQAGVASR